GAAGDARSPWRGSGRRSSARRIRSWRRPGMLRAAPGWDARGSPARSDRLRRRCNPVGGRTWAPPASARRTRPVPALRAPRRPLSAARVGPGGRVALGRSRQRRRLERSSVQQVAGARRDRVEPEVAERLTQDQDAGREHLAAIRLDQPRAPLLLRRYLAPYHRVVDNVPSERFLT